MRFKEDKGVLILKSMKQKLNKSSGTVCELVVVDDLSPKALWAPLFLEEQDCKVNSNMVHQDNQSTILLEKNGKRSSEERMHAMNVRHVCTKGTDESIWLIGGVVTVRKRSSSSF